MMELKEVWDKHSKTENYNNVSDISKLFHSKDQIIKWLIIISANSSVLKVLDLGCGIGQYVMAANILGFKATGLDISPDAVKIARKNKLNVVQGDIRKILFKDKSFDIVIAGGSLEHFPETKKGFSEVSRVIKDGGIFLGNVPNKFTIYVPIKKLQQVLGIWKCGYEKSFSKRRLKRLLKGNGFSILDMNKSKISIGRHKIISHTLRTIDTLLCGGHHHYFICKKENNGIRR